MQVPETARHFALRVLHPTGRGSKAEHCVEMMQLESGQDLVRTGQMHLERGIFCGTKSVCKSWIGCASRALQLGKLDENHRFGGPVARCIQHDWLCRDSTVETGKRRRIPFIQDDF
jgi:hypothetical protein